MNAQEKGLIISETEIALDLPLGLKYFLAVDALIQNVHPIDRIYFDILVYEKGIDQPAVNILRTLSYYRDGKIGKQDEIGLANKPNRLQFNAECASNDAYLQYPNQIRMENKQYLEEVVNIFTRLGHIEGSHIRINHQNVWMSQNGVWLPFQGQSQATLPPESPSQLETGE